MRQVFVFAWSHIILPDDWGEFTLTPDNQPQPLMTLTRANCLCGVSCCENPLPSLPACLPAFTPSSHSVEQTNLHFINTTHINSTALLAHGFSQTKYKGLLLDVSSTCVFVPEIKFIIPSASFFSACRRVRARAQRVRRAEFTADLNVQ